MDVSVYQLSIIAGGFTIVGALIGALVSYRLSKVFAKNNAIVNAQAKLRATFAPSLAQIYLAQKHGNHDRPDINSFVKENLLGHASAVEEFRPHIPCKNRVAYQDAWENYRKIANDSIESATEDRVKGVELGGALEKSIHKILSFAKSEFCLSMALEPSRPSLE